MSKREICDYCGDGPRIVKGTPFLADAGKKMCSACWKNVKAEHWDSSQEFIPAFKHA